MTKNYNTNYFYAFSFLIMLLLSNMSQAQTTTWTGSWDNGDPDITKDVIFTANYTSPSNISAKSVLVSGGAQVTIASNHTFTIENNITVAVGSNLIFETNASLLQINPTAINTGNINYKRDSSPMKFFEYTYWSTPVAGETLVGFSPLTSPSRFHSYDSTINNWVNESPTNTMQSGRGYAIRSPDDYTTTPQTFNGEFIGVPNNGDIPTTVIAFNPGLLNYNFIGNPYPSAISVISLLDNSNLGTMYFWTHNTAIAGNSFTTNDYAIRTRTTGTAAISGGAAPGLFIAAGQGFFASAATTTTLTFKNIMRVANSNSQFYKNSQVVPLNYYIHLNLTNTSGAFKQIAFGYEELATNGYDFGTDALASTEGAITFYSLISPYTFGFGIQGRSYPWDINDVIDLGFNATIAGDYTIAIDHVNPFFDTQDIFIEDTALGTYHNLKTAPYNFNTAVGIFNSRLKIHYQNPLLSNNGFTIIANSVLVNTSNNEIEINSISEKIKTIQVYDVLGRLIFDEKNVKENKFSIASIRKQNQALIIKIELENNQIVTKKVIF
ncbi:T9SS sorting signal type C domain-containing protein [Flavobacterium sp.]|uniref:T9SS sorting signal type C domain-containing protein n=1 Tax=Flavobacterium sp. TaxID=239 RepID=UPI0038FD3B5F